MLFRSVLSKMETSEQVKTNNSPKQLKAIIEERLSSNNLAIPTDTLVINVEKTGLTLDWQYERRSNWISNIDIVVSFQQRAEF